MKTRIRLSVLLIAILAAISFGGSNAMALDAPKIGTDMDKGQAKMTDTVDQATAMKDGIDINSATPEMLAKIPGVDSTIADSIAKYREANGAFSSAKDLLKVDGITPELLDKIKPFLSMLQSNGGIIVKLFFA